MTGEETGRIPWSLRLGRYAWIASLGVGYYIYRNLLFHTQIGNNIILKRDQLEDLKSRNFTVLDNVLVHGHYINQQPKRSFKNQRVAVVGGGKQGVAISKKLLDSGYEVILIDKQDEMNSISYEHPHKLNLSSFFRGLLWSDQNTDVSWSIFMEKYFTLWLTNSIYSYFNKSTNNNNKLEELSQEESQKYSVQSPLLYDYMLGLCRQNNLFLEVKKCIVKKYVISNQNVIGLETTHGFFLVDSIVIASGSAAKDLVGLLGYRLPLLTGSFYSAETQPLSEEILRSGIEKLDKKQINAFSRGDRAGIFTSLILEASALQRDVHAAISPNYKDIQEVQIVKQQAFNVEAKSLSHKVFSHVLIPDGNPIVDKVYGYPNIYLGIGGQDNQKMGVAAQISKFLEGEQNDLGLSMRRFLLV